MADFMQGLMGMFTPGAEGIGGLLSEGERKKIASQALMTTAMKLLASGGRSAQPISLGQALGGAYLTGQEAMGQGVTNAAQNLLLSQKIKEAQTEADIVAKQGEIFARKYGGQAPGKAITGMQAIQTPGALGPTVEKAALIGQQPVSAEPKMTEKQFQAQQYRDAAALWTRRDPSKSKALHDIADKLDPQIEWGTTPQEVSIGGNPVFAVFSKSGDMKVLPGVSPKPGLKQVDAGDKIEMREERTGKVLWSVPKTMTPGEQASNKVSWANVNISQGNQDIRLQELNRPQTVVNADAGGVISIPQTPISIPGARAGGGSALRPAVPLSQSQQTLAQPPLPRGITPMRGAPTPTQAQAAMQPNLFKIPGMEKDPTEGQGAAVAYGIRLASAHETLKELEGKTGGEGTGKIRGAVSGAVGVLPLVGDKLGAASDSIFNALPTFMGGLNPEQQKALQARVEFITAILRRESGASISVGEFANAEKQYFPQPGDPPEVIKQKQEARERTIEGVRFQAGRFGSRIPAGKSSNFSVSNW